MADLIVLDDTDLARVLTPADTIGVMRDALARHARDELVTPPRTRVALGPGGNELVVGACGAPGIGYGFRCYETGLDSPEQLTAVWSAATGLLAGVVAGRLLGEYRTGALGALAIEAVRKEQCGLLAVIGCGRQAWAQLWALSAIGEPAEVRVFARNGAGDFAQKITTELGWPAQAAPDANAAVDGADVIVLATNSTIPVVELEWLDPLAHLNTIGPKTSSEHELDPGAYRGRVVFTDSAAQVACYPGGCAFTGNPLEMSKIAPVQRREGTVYLSVGLTGTEVLLADYAISLCANGL